RAFDVAGHAAFGVTGEIEIQVDRAAPLQVAHVDAGLAETLHRDQADHGARPLDAGLVAAGAAVTVAPAAGRKIGALARPFAGQRADILGGDAGFLLLPFRRLRNPVFLAHDVGLP